MVEGDVLVVAVMVVWLFLLIDGAVFANTLAVENVVVNLVIIMVV